MVNKEILNQEFLKSIESEYIFDNAPINRFNENKENDDSGKKLRELKNNPNYIFYFFPPWGEI